MKKIFIGISYRIDMPSYLVPNSVFAPIRCGAIYDKYNWNDIKGDDVDINISDKRKSYCELTVQYWLWKNVKADYYGLCHYRRFLAFNNGFGNVEVDERNHIQEDVLDSDTCRKYELDDANCIQEMVDQYDVITSNSFDVSKVRTPKGYRNSVLEHWKAFDKVFIMKKDLDVLFQIIYEKYPDYYPDAMEYMNGTMFLGYNCFVMRKDLFFELCEYEFSILEELERRIDMSGYKGDVVRTPGYMGEILYSIFVYHFRKRNQYRITERQLVFFKDVTYAYEKEKISNALSNNYVPIICIMDTLQPSVWMNTFESIIKYSSSWDRYIILIYYRFLPEELKGQIFHLFKGCSNICISFYDINSIDLGESKQYIEHLEMDIYLPWLLKELNYGIVINKPCVFFDNILGRIKYVHMSEKSVISFDIGFTIIKVSFDKLRKKYDLDKLYETIHNNRHRFEDCFASEIEYRNELNIKVKDDKKRDEEFNSLPLLQKIKLIYPKGSWQRNLVLKCIPRKSIVYKAAKLYK
jgi:hypothetical protein